MVGKVATSSVLGTLNLIEIISLDVIGSFERIKNKRKIFIVIVSHDLGDN